MQINKIASYVRSYIYVHISIASSWLGADIYDGGDSTSRIRVEISTAGILSMLEIASYKYNYWQVNRACQIWSVHHDQWGDC